MFYSSHLHTLDKLFDCNQPLHNGLLGDRALTQNAVWFHEVLMLPIKLATVDYMLALADHFQRHNVFWNLHLDLDLL